MNMPLVNMTPQVKFSLDVCRGSAQDRRDFASNINEQIFNDIEPGIQKDRAVKISDFKESLHKNLPEDKRVDVLGFKPEKDNEEGCSDLIEDDDGNYIGQTIEIPSKRGKVTGSSMVILFHETRHVLDILTNPKYTARVKSMYANDLYSRSYNNLLDKFYSDLEEPTPENKEKELKDLKKRLNKFLKNKPVEHQLDCLQDLRYVLETERNAYADQYKFETRLDEQGINPSEYELEDEAQYYSFDEKIELLKQTAADVIAKEREKHRLSLEG